MLSKQAIQTGIIVFVLTVCIQEQVKRSDWLLMALIEDQDQLLQGIKKLMSKNSWTKIKAPRWSEDCRNKDADQRTTDCLKEPQESAYFSLFILIDSCVRFAKSVELNHIHKEKVFHGKAWHIVSRSGTEISVPAVPTQKHANNLVFKFPNPCGLWSVTRVMEYLMTWVFRKEYLRDCKIYLCQVLEKISGKNILKL